ncbi:MAG TPA: hypothetical protein VK536_02260 [Candidatus Limnocylindrales bacterium]|nr:hypothetical protein [Candidatus Limnocylindrales bacterium]
MRAQVGSKGGKSLCNLSIQERDRLARWFKAFRFNGLVFSSAKTEAFQAEARIMPTCMILFLEEQQVDFAFFDRFVLGCFFGAEFESFAGCVSKRQQASLNVNRRQ